MGCGWRRFWEVCSRPCPYSLLPLHHSSSRSSHWNSHHHHHQQSMKIKSRRTPHHRCNRANSSSRQHIPHNHRHRFSRVSGSRSGCSCSSSGSNSGASCSGSGSWTGQLCWQTSHTRCHRQHTPPVHRHRCSTGRTRINRTSHHHHSCHCCHQSYHQRHHLRQYHRHQQDRH